MFTSRLRFGNGSSDLLKETIEQPVQKLLLRYKNTSMNQTATRNKLGRFVKGHQTNVTHGHASGHSPTYRSWFGAKQRCVNPNNPRFEDYGGRGVKMAARWLSSFENFLADMGERPAGTSLDRYPNRNGNYEPSNCRWATPKQQQNNTRSNVYLTYGGTRLTVSMWADRLGIKSITITTRLRRDWSVSRALTTPVGKYERKGR